MDSTYFACKHPRLTGQGYNAFDDITDLTRRSRCKVCAAGFKSMCLDDDRYIHDLSME